jgi:hypothetical protein
MQAFDLRNAALVPDDPAHDVVAKCKNGRLHKPVDDLYVIFRINLEGDCPDADAVAHSFSPDFGSLFVEQIACKELYNRFWDHEKEGSPCFDIYDDDGEIRPFPSGKFMMWDPEDKGDDEHGLPKVNVPTLTIYGDGPEHKPIKRYKIAKTQLTIQDLMSIETEGDKFFTR